MARPSRTGGKTRKTKVRKASAARAQNRQTKRSPASTFKSKKPATVSAPGSELQEAREQQAATAEILKVIASSPSDVQPVFEAIAASANKLIGGFSTAVFRYVDGMQHLKAFTPTNPAADKLLMASFPRPLARSSSSFELVRDGKPGQIADTEAAPDALTRKLARLRGFRSMLFSPLMSNGAVIGLITVTRVETGSFANQHVQLLQTFADQAVIAIENVRLFNETQEALAQQTATSDVLGVISSSVADTTPVFEKILDSCENLFAVEQLGIFLLQPDGQVYAGAWRGAAFEAIIKTLPSPVEQTATGAVIRNRGVLHAPSLAQAKDLPRTVRDLRDQIGDASMAWAPMLADEQGVGSIAVLRQPPRAFSDKELTLLKTFADQAVIAIQNARLFNETREALERQTATSEVLEVINSSPGNLAPVFDAMLEKAIRLCNAVSGHFRTYDGVSFPLAAVRGEADHLAAMRQSGPLVPGPHHPVSRILAGETLLHMPNTKESEEYRSDTRFRSLVDRGVRSLLTVALRKDGLLLGYINVYRHVAEPFTDRQIALLQNFASQAVVAMENARLITETREALERQTATADILKVIASSPSDVRPVFNAIVHSAAQLFEPCTVTILMLKDGQINWEVQEAARPDGDFSGAKAIFPIPFDPVRSVSARAIQERRIIEIPDTEAADTPEFVRKASAAGGFRNGTYVPLIHQDQGIGVIVLAHPQPGFKLSKKQLELVQTFADQAVIAIENARLFEEVQAKTRDLSESLQQQTATADVLKVISRSTFDLQAVLQALVESAAKLSDSDKATITRQRDGVFYRAETYGFSDEFMEYARSVPIVPDRSSATGRALMEGTVVHIPDVKADADYTFREGQRLGDFRAVLAVPMLRERVPIGVIVLTRTEARAFNQKQIELVTTFADQAAIAIENVRLFESVQARTRELAKSLEDLRTAQDRLVQTEKLASLGQLTAGIAHEIKNPLNFVNNFSALSAELVDEMADVFENPALDEANKRKELDEIRDLLKSNLEKVVQHGKRADSIVKNMLLHSREGSGEQRSADINALVDESLNLAYHGARAEKSGFNITLQRDFDASAGSAELFPQEITRALLNLISNGFYAASKRSSDGEAGFEPTLLAATKSLGNSVEIRIRDNGAGIPSEIKEKIFNPFFTTKPAGEGTGLGLSMSHDIIVKQHGGTIRVNTELGAFTEFIVTLPRAISVQSPQRSPN